MIGINTQIVSPSGSNSGVGFAVPVDIVRTLVPQLIEHGHATYAGLTGLTVADDSLAKRLGVQRGALVLGAEQGGAAAVAGLRGATMDVAGHVSADVITGIDDQNVDSVRDIQRLLEAKSLKDIVMLKVVRDGKTISLKASLGPVELE